MNERGLEAFTAIVMGQTLRRAAELLNLTQSAVSYRLKELEDDLGTILVDRRKGLKAIRLTPAGRDLLPLAMQWQELQGQVRSFRSKVPAHFLMIGSVDSMNNHVLPPLFKALRKNEPPVFCRITTSDSIVLYRKIESREVDVAFVLQEQHFPYVSVEPFTRERMLVLRVKQEGLPSRIRADELDPRFELRFPWSSPYQLWHDKVWPPEEIGEIFVDTLLLVRNLLQDERQWAIIPESSAPFMMERDLMVQTLVPPPPDRLSYKLTHRYPKGTTVEALDILNRLIAGMDFGNAYAGLL